MHGSDEVSCEGYFCDEHKHHSAAYWDDSYHSICSGCAKALLETGEWKIDEEEGVIVSCEEVAG